MTLKEENALIENIIYKVFASKCEDNFGTYHNTENLVPSPNSARTSPLPLDFRINISPPVKEFSLEMTT